MLFTGKYNKTNYPSIVAIRVFLLPLGVDGGVSADFLPNTVAVVLSALTLVALSSVSLLLLLLLLCCDCCVGVVYLVVVAEIEMNVGAGIVVVVMEGEAELCKKSLWFVLSVKWRDFSCIS